MSKWITSLKVHEEWLHVATSSWHQDYDTPRLALYAPHTAARRVRRVDRVGMGLLCQDGEVEGVDAEDDVVLLLYDECLPRMLQG